MSDHATNIGRVAATIGDVVAGLLTAGAYLGHFANFSDIAAFMAVCWYTYSFGKAVYGWTRHWINSDRED